MGTYTTSHNKRALQRASADKIFAQIITSSNPQQTLEDIEKASWLHMTSKFKTTAWIKAAIDARNNEFKFPAESSTSAEELKEIEAVVNHIRTFSDYSGLLLGIGENPFTDYLNGMTVQDFRNHISKFRGMDVAREIMKLYGEGILSVDLGGTQLHRYMEQLDLPSVPTVSHLNAARRGETPKGQYNMTRSRERNEKFINKMD